MKHFAFLRIAHLLLALFWLCAGSVWANGTVTHLSGAVQTQQADGTLSTTTAGAKFRQGDTLVTGANGYARLEMADGAEMVLRPLTRFRIDSYHYAEEDPARDQSFYQLLQGGLRAISGYINKRGNKDAYRIVTPTATIGVRGTQFDVRYCDANCGALAAGTYVAVRYGAILTKNDFGELQVPAGQAAFTPANAAPVPLPRDPGIGFTPPLSIPKLDEKKKLELQSKPQILEAPGPAAAKADETNTSPVAASSATPSAGTAASASSSSELDAGNAAPPGTLSSGAASAAQCVVQ
jgi:hypothetical protein